MGKAYDKAEWHYGGNYPKGLPCENGGTHIGIFLAWAIVRNLEGELHHNSERKEQALKKMRDRVITGRDFLFAQCGEALINHHLNDEGNRFAEWYYKPNKEGRPNYFADYCCVLTNNSHDSAYRVDDTWENYDRIASIIDRRFDEWKRGIKPLPLGTPPSRKSWWKFC